MSKAILHINHNIISFRNGAKQVDGWKNIWGHVDFGKLEAYKIHADYIEKRWCCFAGMFKFFYKSTFRYISITKI